MTDEALDVFARQLLLDVSHLEVSSAPQGKHTFSPNFERKMKKMIRHQKRMHSMLDNPDKWMRGKTRPMWQKIVQRVAVFFLICVIGLSSAMIASADVREAIVNWFIETFPQYSIFRMETESPSDTLNISSDDIEIGYIPDGYVPKNQNESLSRITFRYSSEGVDATLVISFSTGSPSYLDTEDTEIVETTLGENAAFWWVHESQLFLVWSQNKIMCSISGEISIDEAFKIAENIKLSIE